MISAVSLSLAGYQAVALLLQLPRISQLFSRYPLFALAMALWMAWLGTHVIVEARCA